MEKGGAIEGHTTRMEKGGEIERKRERRTTRVEKAPKDSCGWRCAFHMANRGSSVLSRSWTFTFSRKSWARDVWFGVPPSHSWPQHTQKATSIDRTWHMP